MSAKLKIKKHNNIPVLRIIGQLDAPDVNALSKKLDSLAKGKHLKIVVDLSETTYIDSHGLGVFVYAWKTMESNNHELIFMNPQGLIKSIFEGANLHQIMRVINTLEEV